MPPAVGEPGVSERLAYRPEIDGMRAIAVAAVVLYHAGAAGFRGGFVGVDIFFVISGFLITSLIRKHVEAEDFSFTEFYERRVRRILPAFIVMLAFCCLVAPFVLLPEDLRQFFDSVLGSILFVSNMLFAREYDYFGQAPIYNPLLHVWSLSVEEQFYIALPVLLVVVHRLRRWSATIVVSALAIASFVLSIWMVRHRPEVAFYVAPTRAWELLLGSLLALGAFPRLRHQHVRTFVAATGLALIVGSIALLSEYHSFPGANALYPCLGAALIIHAETGSTSPVGRLLQLSPLRALGLVSYSLYLWHWPLLVFAKYYIIRELHWLETVGIVAASVVAAGLSWHFIEKPFRAAGAVLPQARLFAATVSLIAAFALFGLVNGTLVSPFGGSAVAQTTDSPEARISQRGF